MREPLKALTYVGIDSQTGNNRYEMLAMCPFCGDRLEHMAGGKLEPRSHSVDDCDPEEKLLKHTLRIKRPSGYYDVAVQDIDGDWWLFECQLEYHEPHWYLRPIPPTDLLAITHRAAEYYVRMSAEAQHTHNYLEDRIHGRK
jgi:hypothetical protein